MSRRVSVCLYVSIALLFAPSMAAASDGQETDNHPAVGVYFVAATYVDGSFWAGGYCSGTLIAEDTFLTAAHCTFYDTRELAEGLTEEADAWVSFDPVALDNDFWCFLQDIAYPGADGLACDPSSRTEPEPVFHLTLNNGITHPGYPRIHELGNGSLAITEPLGPHNPDLGVLILEEPITGIAPHETAPRGFLDELDPARPPAVGVGYGLNYHKSHPADPNQPGGDGPTTFEGDFGVRRIADLGEIRNVTPSRVTPTQRNSQGEDSVCYGDSGSPLFVVQDGALDRRVVGVLTGGALWCQGANDPYQRVDIETAIDFLDCIEAAPTMAEACACGIEQDLGQCDGL